MNPIRIYWAGDLFDHKDLTGNILLARTVKKFSEGRYEPVLPQEAEADQNRSLNIRDYDYDMLISCDVILTNFDGPDLDSGTAAEFIFAKMLDMPAVLMRTDFRCPAESAVSPDPWNLMCSGFPRSRSLIIHGINCLYQIKKEMPPGADLVSEYHKAIALKIIHELDLVCRMKPVFKFQELPAIYRNALRSIGGPLAEQWSTEKTKILLNEKKKKGIYGDATAKSNDAGFRMDLEKDEVRKFESATHCGNSRKNTNFGLSRVAERQVGTLDNRVGD